MYQIQVGSPCLSFLDIRAYKMRNKLARKKVKSISTTIKALLHDALHTLDIITDLSLAKIMYDYSRDELIPKNGKQITHDYNLCFVWICLTSFGPYLVQYSS